MNFSSVEMRMPSEPASTEIETRWRSISGESSQPIEEFRGERVSHQPRGGSSQRDGQQEHRAGVVPEGPGREDGGVLEAWTQAGRTAGRSLKEGIGARPLRRSGTMGEIHRPSRNVWDG